jgi:hypothetical protein
VQDEGEVVEGAHRLVVVVPEATLTPFEHLRQQPPRLFEFAQLTETERELVHRQESLAVVPPLHPALRGDGAHEEVAGFCVLLEVVEDAGKAVRGSGGVRVVVSVDTATARQHVLDQGSGFVGPAHILEHDTQRPRRCERHGVVVPKPGPAAFPRVPEQPDRVVHLVQLVE